MNISTPLQAASPRRSGDDSPQPATAAGDLRRLLREKFPEAQTRYEAVSDRAAAADDSGGARVRETAAGVALPRSDPNGIPEERDGRFLQTGLAALDAAGLEKGAITEVVGDPHSACGAGLVIAAVVREASREGRFVALVDGRDTFDPRSLGSEEECRTLLWVRCGEVGKAIQTADFLLRDGNLPLVVLDLQLSCKRELGRVPGSTWFRLRSLAEQTGAPLLAITPRPLISCARLRLGLPENGFALAAVELPRAELEAALRPQVLRRRNALLYTGTPAALAERMAG